MSSLRNWGIPVAAVALFTVGAMLLGRSTDTGEREVSVVDQPLSGTIGGKPWQTTGGEVDPYLSTEDELFVTLHFDTIDDCGDDRPLGSKVVFGVPPRVGTYDDAAVTFVDWEAEAHVNAAQARLEVQEVDEEVVRGKLFALLDGDNQVEGVFEAHRCAIP